MNSYPTVLVHVLARDKSKTLPLYLECLEKLKYPKKSIILYLVTNNNTDNTKKLLQEYIIKNNNLYQEIIFDCKDLDFNIEQYGVHEWNATRLTVIRHLRDKGLAMAREKSCDFYFTCDIDNYIMPYTLNNLVSANVPVISPLIKYADDHMEINESEYPKNVYNYKICNTLANFTNVVTPAGDVFYVEDPNHYPHGYMDILNRKYPGLYQVELVHQVYLIRKDVFSCISYQNGYSFAFDYINLCHLLRSTGIPQIIDTRHEYGYFTFTENQEVCRRYMNNIGFYNGDKNDKN